MIPQNAKWWAGEYSQKEKINPGSKLLFRLKGMKKKPYPSQKTERRGDSDPTSKK